jgi:hypothetical protein
MRLTFSTAALLAQHYLNVVATHSCRDRIAARSCRDRNLHPLPRWKRKLLQAVLQTGTLVVYNMLEYVYNGVVY